MPVSELYLILNPAADRGRAAGLESVLRDSFLRAGIRIEVARTRGRGHASELAEHAARGGWPGVVAVGGDGVVHEVVNGLVRAAEEAVTVPLGVVPAGSGNDFAKAIAVHGLSTPAAARRIATAEPRAVDVGQVSRWVAASGPTAPWCFVNGIGLGFDAQVAVQASRIRRLRGMAIYLTAVFRVLSDLKAPRMQVSVNGREVADRRLVLTTIANGACHGGSFWLCPAARVDDGELDVLIADARGVAELVRLIPRVMRGRHLTARGVALVRGSTASVRSEDPLPIHADGEIVGEGVREIEMRVLPGRLSILA